MIDAVAFALALPLPRGKHTHVRNLVYASDPASLQGAGNDDVARGMRHMEQSSFAEDIPPPDIMFVKLNFEGGTSLKRTYNVFDQVTEQSVIAQGGLETPVTLDEYKEKIQELKLNIGEFCLYQDRLLDYTKQNLNQIFEKLSGSQSFKEEYESLLAQKKQLEQQIRQMSSLLKEKRHEKIKVQGLSEYQKQIENCIDEQKQVSELLAIVKILVKEKEIEKLNGGQSVLA